MTAVPGDALVQRIRRPVRTVKESTAIRRRRHSGEFLNAYTRRSSSNRRVLRDLDRAGCATHHPIAAFSRGGT